MSIFDNPNPITSYINDEGLTRKRLEWVRLFTKGYSGIEPKSVPELFKCPRSATCVMDCYHKDPHVYEEKYCNGLDGHCHTKCVHELISDVTFFKEDFDLD